MNPIVIIPCHNAAEHLRWCLRSVRQAQVVIFDSGSDACEAIAKEFPNVEYNRTPHTFEEHGEMFCRATMTAQVKARRKPTHIVTIDADELLADNWLENFDTWSPRSAVKTMPYWQLLGDARYMQVGNPIEYRPTIFPVHAGPQWIPQPGRNYHCGPLYDGISTPTPIARIHLGWAGDLRRRLNMVVDRKDWSTRDDVNADAKARIAENPFIFLHPVEPVAQHLLDSSSVLRELVAEHTARRIVTTAPHGDALKITHINYAN